MSESPDDFSEETAGSLPGEHSRFGRRAKFADIALADIMVKQVFAGRQLNALQRPGSCVVVSVPSADWVTPIAEACEKLTTWGEVVTVTKAEPKNRRESSFRKLAAGRSILCISQLPEAHLPPSLIALADMRVTMVAPDSAAIRKVIGRVTGSRCPVLPEGLGAGVDFQTLCAAIRHGSSPRRCIERLTAAKPAGAHDPGLAEVPLLNELAGYGKAMIWCKRLADDIDLHRRGLLDFHDIQRTAVFASEPGLGKTTLVRSLAKTAGLPLFATSVSSWFAQGQGYLDSVLKEIDKLFAAASAVAPAIILIDECEGIPSRSTMKERDAAFWTPIIGHLLTLLDGAASGANSRLVVIGATNHVSKLDPALVRSGRLSPVIRIDRPNKGELPKIFRQHLGGDLPDVDLVPLAAMSYGASGADIAGWVKAARAAARSSSRPVCFEDLLDQIIPSAELDVGMARRIACHEAGHAVVAEVIGVAEVQMVVMAGGEGVGGRTYADLGNLLLTKQLSERIVVFLLAGMCAEETFEGAASSGAGGSPASDLARATEMVCANHVSLGFGKGLAYRGTPDDATRLLLQDPALLANVQQDLARLRAASAALVEDHRAEIADLTDLLVRDRIVPGDAVRNIVSRARAERLRNG